MKLWNKICAAIETLIKKSVRVFVKGTKKVLKITKAVAPVVVSGMYLIDGGSFTGAVCRFVGAMVYGEIVYWYICALDLEMTKREREEAAVVA